MSKRKLRFILSGPGLIGRKHAELISEHPDAELVRVVAPDNERNRDFSDNYAISLYTDFSAAIKKGDIDAAVISSPTSCHFEQAKLCIDHSIPVLVEKPLTDHMETALSLCQHAEASKIIVLVGHHRTYHPLLDATQNFINSEKFGSPVALYGSALFMKPDNYFKSGQWRTKKGGGPLLINMIHEIGILRYLFGEIESVSAKISSKRRKLEVEDTAAISMSFANSALGTFVISDIAASNKSWEMTSGENSSYPTFPSENYLHMAGTEGSIDFPSLRYRTYNSRSEKSWWSNFSEGRIQIKKGNALERQLQHFIDVIQGHATPRVSAWEGYQNLRVVNTILEAANTRCTINIGNTN